MSPALTAALADWLAWVERGAPEGEPYRSNPGLCWNTSQGKHSFYAELADIFKAQGYPDFEYPFANFREREAWVRKMLAEHEMIEELSGLEPGDLS